MASTTPRLPIAPPAAKARVEVDPNCAACGLLGHKWAPQIVAVLLSGPHRFTALHRALPALSEKVLSRRLDELEAAGLVSRTQFAEIPPRVEYALTPIGSELRDGLAELDRWSRRYALRTEQEQR